MYTVMDQVKKDPAKLKDVTDITTTTSSINNASTGVSVTTSTNATAGVYPYDKKKRLAKKISTLKRKEDMVKILEIIYEDNKNITENQNGLFMFFHKLNDSTYHKIDLYLRMNTKKKTSDEKSVDESSSSFISYAKNEFSDTNQKSISESNPKLKYSNREKNIIKRQRYSEQLHSENNTDSHVLYTKFDMPVLSDTANQSSENNVTTPITKKALSITSTENNNDDDITKSPESDIVLIDDVGDTDNTDNRKLTFYEYKEERDDIEVLEEKIPKKKIDEEIPKRKRGRPKKTESLV